MHHSRLSALGIDVSAETHTASANFWAGALGRSVEPDDDGSSYLNLGNAGGLVVFVQRVGEGGPPIHVDIKTDNVAAEVSRLEGLGATRVEQEWSTSLTFE